MAAEPSLGIEKLLHDWGFVNAEFRWLVDPDMAIYTIVIAGVWQVAGFVMALFLAGLRGVDTEILKAARVDGASPWKTYTRIIIPALRPVFMTAFVIQGNLAIKSYDLVISLTKGGPGYLHRAALDVHVLHHVQPERPGPRRLERGGHADGGGRHRRPLSLFGAAR